MYICSYVLLNCFQKKELKSYLDCTNIKHLKLDESGKIGYTFKSLGCAFWALKQDDFRKAISTITLQVSVLKDCVKPSW